MTELQTQDPQGNYAVQGTFPSSGDSTATPAYGTGAVEEVQPQSEWDRLWEAVHKNPEDFASWEYLLRTAENEEGGITQDSSETAQGKLRLVYDRFLAKFPLCFGYWKKYADWEQLLDGPETAGEIYERGVVSIRNSVELWTHYCTFKVENFAVDEEGIRALFERGADHVGSDFLSHPFWDKYIEFEDSKANHAGLMKILERIIHIPMHQYARYFERLSTLSVSQPVTSLVTADQYAKLEQEVRFPIRQEGQDATTEPPVLTEEEVHMQIRQKIHTLKSAIYMSTQEAVQKRWVFEAEIKRPYFHVKPLDEPQLINWRRYLDFEEGEGDQDRIYTLYERCLVPCALYEEFWQRYVRFLLSVDNRPQTRAAFLRATTLFVPPTRPSIRLASAAFEEEEGRITEARDIYSNLLRQVPGHLETITKFAYFERRQASVDSALEILNGAEATIPDDDSKAYLEVVRARLLLHTKNADEARQVFNAAAQRYTSSKYFLLSYIQFEAQTIDLKSLTHLQQAWDCVRKSALAPEDKRDLGRRYLDILYETSTLASEINKIELEVDREFMDKAGEASRKRAADAEGAGARPIKQIRASVPAVMPAAVAGMVGSASVYPPQQLVPQAAYNGYAAYPQQGYGAGAYHSAGAGMAGGQGWDYSQHAAAGY
ncbi:hypothetical protein HDU87_000217 [Geranomyces variabilis]|uniref:Pre-mRNA-processing factor 39 n=1 Tax=Geranomyces variabilis TaxID=109894 RepID=A0AAD5XW62_9FUNG|nr:hypothetical protein HDU87_000217 [Geranomyces variabilis]